MICFLAVYLKIIIFAPTNMEKGRMILLRIAGRTTQGKAYFGKALGLDDKIGFGKYKDMTLKEVIIKDWQYVKWAIIDSQHFYTDVDKVLEYHMENRPTLGPNDIMSFGKYKGKSIEEVCKTDRQYLIWLSQNNDSFNLDWEKFK